MKAKQATVLRLQGPTKFTLGHLLCANVSNICLTTCSTKHNINWNAAAALVQNLANLS